MLMMLFNQAHVHAIVLVGSHMCVGLRQLRIASSGSFEKLVTSSKKTGPHAGVLLESHAYARLRSTDQLCLIGITIPSNGMLIN